METDVSRNLLLLTLITTGFLTACGRDEVATEPAEAEPATAELAAQKAPPGDQTAIRSEDLLAHVSVLASDEFGGRAPMSEGETLTLDYLEKAFRAYGLEPLFGDQYRQPVPLVAIGAAPDANLTVSGPDGEKTYLYGPEAMVGTLRVLEQVTVKDSEFIWVGHGIVAPEYDWNDYQGVDVRGKTVLMLVNDPGYRTQNASLFNGNAMTYYGRWTYKFEEAARQGAEAVIIIHDTLPAAYPWEVVKNSWSGPQFYLATPNDNLDRAAVEGWVTREVAEQLLSRAGQDLAALEQAASTSSVEPLPLGLTLSVELNNTIERAESFNVGALLPGTEAADEAFVYMAHWDHLGIVRQEDDAPDADVIYNGALDNASGTAGLLELAQAWSARLEKPRRSVAFVSVTAEESGLLGSQAYAANPAFPVNKTAGALNMDGLNIYGPTSDVVVVGYGASELEDTLKALAAEQNRTVAPEAHPERGSFYRSDHFNIAKKGVPVLYAKNGMLHVELGPDYIDSRMSDFIANHYHKPSDELTDDWDLRGAVEDLHLYFWIGETIADGDDWPEWYPGNEFRAIREASMNEATP
jgi:Zn-dependent M28 family amino/carboxypeptidase